LDKEQCTASRCAEHSSSLGLISVLFQLSTGADWIEIVAVRGAWMHVFSRLPICDFKNALVLLLVLLEIRRIRFYLPWMTRLKMAWTLHYDWRS